jgi:hypothetical protein
MLEDVECLVLKKRKGSGMRRGAALFHGKRATSGITD